MKHLLIFIPILFTVTAFGQQTLGKINFPPIDKSKMYFYSPTFQTKTYHSMESVGNLNLPFDSITNNHILISSVNMDYSLERTLLDRCYDSNNQLKIIVDLSQFTGKELNFYESYPLNRNYSTYPRQIITKDNSSIIHKTYLTKDQNITVVAQPVYIANLSDSTRYLLGISGLIIITQQAKDKNGKWRDIETSELPSCGMVKYICELKRNDFVLTSVLRFNGNYKTQLRIKLEANNQTYYSEPFAGNIDYLQIDNPKIKIINNEPAEKL